MPQIQKRGLQLMGLDLVNHLQRNSEIPGRLRVQHGLLKAWFIAEQSQDEIVIKSPAKYTAAQNWGSTHMIRPKNKKALHWGGQPGFFSKGHTVHIPGKHFIEKSIKEVEPKTDDYFKLAIQEVLG
jgi:phage gpG-like protein